MRERTNQWLKDTGHGHKNETDSRTLPSASNECNEAINAGQRVPLAGAGSGSGSGHGVVHHQTNLVHAVIHFVMTPDSGKVQIPAIFRGEMPASSDSELGTKNYSQKSIAVILGAGYDDEGAKVMMEASKGIYPIPWLRPDTSQPTPPIGPEYGKALGQRIKDLAPQLEKEDKMNEENVFWY